jgi:carboxymethylenebutenolidase
MLTRSWAAQYKHPRLTREDEMSERVTFTSKNGDTVGAALGLPAGGGKAPAVVVIQEWWGLNPQIEGIVDRLAGEGFVAFAPDLYRGVIAKDATEAGKMMKELDGKRAMADLEGAVAYLREHARGNGKVAMTGFCMGGAYTLASACAIRGLAAAVPFYGIPPKADYAKLEAPILFHVAEHDGWVSPAAAREVEAAVKQHGGSIRLELYDADHAFMNEKRPEVYSAEASALAWKRTVEFLKQHTA